MLIQRAFLAVFACALSACGSDPVEVGYYPYVPGAGRATGSGGAVGQGGSGTCSPHRSVLVGAATNARDLGGTPLEGGGAVACGQLYRGAPLAAFTEQGCAAFAELGIRTVIDLRIEEERVTSPDSACVADSAKLVFSPLPVPYSVSAQDYIADLDAIRAVAALRALGDDAAYPIYFHCTWGRDRTGVLGAVILLALGATRTAILEEYMLSEALVGAYPNSLVAVLDEVERRGGIEAYFAAAGISEAELAVLRARAIAR